MSNAKPICLVYYDNSPQRLKSEQVQDFLSKKWTDYHVLVLPPLPNPQNIIELEVYYDKDFTEIQFETLKKDIVTYIEKVTKERLEAKEKKDASNTGTDY